MSGKKVKAARRAQRLEEGTTKDQARSRREFEAVIARAKMELATKAAGPIVRRDGRRRALGVAGLLIIAALLLAFLALGAR